MKKKILFILVLLLIPFTNVYAKEYHQFDIRFEEEIGTNVKNNEIKIFASADDNLELIDRTSEFTMEDVQWFKYYSEIEDGKTKDDYDYVDESSDIYAYAVTDDDVFEENYKYFLYIPRLYANEEDSFHRNISINGKDIEEIHGICYNTGNEFLIKTVAPTFDKIQLDDAPEVEENTLEDKETVLDTTKEEKTCMLGCSLCCTMFLGISICIWIIIAIILLLIIILIICIKSKNKKRNN